jgi:hypothetical protein
MIIKTGQYFQIKSTLDSVTIYDRNLRLIQLPEKSYEDLESQILP